MKTEKKGPSKSNAFNAVPYPERQQTESLRVKVDSVIHRQDDPMKISILSSNATPRNLDGPDTPNINSFKYTFALDDAEGAGKLQVASRDLPSDGAKPDSKGSGVFRSVHIDDL